MTTNNEIQSNTTNPALAAAWATYQTALTAVTEAQTALETSITALVINGEKTFRIDDQIYQVRARTDKETGKPFSFLTKYDKLPSEARKVNHDQVVEATQRAMLEKIKTSNPEAYKALVAELGMTEETETEVEAPKATKARRAAKQVALTVD